MRTKTCSKIAGEGPRRTRPQGFTLVEVLVAAMLLMFAMAGLVPFFVSSLNQSATVRYKSAATNIARERMEQIRQLDYREIVDAAGLATRFGASEVIRDVAYGITYVVRESAYESGVLKEVTVTVDWTSPPKVSPASLTTMIHQQYVGPRVSRIELDKSKSDPLGTPFPCLFANQAHAVRAYIAEADWGLVLENLNQPGMTPRDAFLRLNLVDEMGTTFPLGDPDADYKITQLYYPVEAGKVTSVYFEYPFNSANIPDGYWEFQAIAFNRYEEPGNVWRLRTRVENGNPDTPTSVVAVPQPGDASIRLYWSGGDERDRDHYEVERRKWDWIGSVWGSWGSIDPAVDARATNLLDEGSASIPLDPWGDGDTTNWYQYQVRAVDICLPANVSPWAMVEVGLPGGVVTTTTLSTSTTVPSSTTTLAQLATVLIENKDNKVYSLLIECDNPTVPDITTTVERKTTKSLGGLSPGNYLITASTSGRADIVASFSLPAHNGQTVMIIY